MHESDFAFAVGRVLVLENQLLEAGKFERMIEAKNAEEVFRILSETEYAQALGSVKNAAEFEPALDFERRRVHTLVRQLFAGDPGVFELYLLRFDVHNLKVLLKAEATSQSPDGLVDEGVYGIKVLERMVSGEEPAPQPISTFIGAARSAIGEETDPQSIDLAVDGAYFSYVGDLARQKDWRTLTRYWLTVIDMTNLRSLIRCRRLNAGVDFFRRAFLQGGTLSLDSFTGVYLSTGEGLAEWLRENGYGDLLELCREQLTSIPVLERSIAELLHRILMQTAYVDIVGPERLFAYLLTKENEIQKIRLIVVAKINGISREAVRERLYHAHL